MLRRYHRLPTFMVFSALLWMGAVTAVAQTSVEAFRKVLTDQAAFTASDFSALEQGQMVTKLLPVKNKREVAVCGLVRLQAPVDVFLRSVEENVGRKNNQAILQIGKLSNPPTLEDLQTLTLENREIEDMKRCTVGDCNLKMSAAMIERLRNEVNWSAPDYSAQATLLFRQMLLDYVRDYLARGNAALIEYNDRNNAVRVGEEQSALLGGSIYVNDFAPEFSNYLKSFPASPLPGLEQTICWSKIKFGFKPVITLTHVMIYKRQKDSAPQALVASRQIYADHYFDSSLALSALIKIPATSTTSDSYLLYTNRSRADALGGMLGGLTRFIVEREALDGLKTNLQQTKLAMEASSTNQSGKGVDTPDAQRGGLNSGLEECACFGGRSCSF